LLFGEAFTLEREVGGRWQTVAADVPLYFTMEGLGVPPRSQVQHTYSLTGYPQPLAAGEYRIAITYYCDVSYPLYAEFTIS